MDTQLDARFINFDKFMGLRTRYYDRGAGDPVLFLYGGHFGWALPVGIECWSENLDALSSLGYLRVIGLDKLGQGMTAHPRLHRDYTFDNVVRHTKAFIDGLGLHNVTIVGHSRGALLAACIALDVPDKICRVVLVDSATLAPDHPDAPGTKFYSDVFSGAPYELGYEAVIQHYVAAQALSPENWQPHLISALALRMADPVWQTTMKRYKESGVDHSYWLPSLERYRANTLQRLKDGELAMPVNLVWGAQDRSAPLFLGHELFSILAASIADLSYYVINGAGHHVFRDRPRQFNNHLAALLEV